jgi:hypothetical protein
MSKHPSHPSLWQLGIMLILAHFRGYVPVSGTVLLGRENKKGVPQYVALKMRKPQ